MKIHQSYLIIIIFIEKPDNAISNNNQFSSINIKSIDPKQQHGFPSYSSSRDINSVSELEFGTSCWKIQ